MKIIAKNTPFPSQSLYCHNNQIQELYTMTCSPWMRNNIKLHILYVRLKYYFSSNIKLNDIL